jgi:hypothetical protein
MRVEPATENSPMSAQSNSVFNITAPVIPVKRLIPGALYVLERL